MGIVIGGTIAEPAPNASLHMLSSIGRTINYTFVWNYLPPSIGLRECTRQVLTEPWLVLPAETLHGLTFATMWAATIEYAHEIAPGKLTVWDPRAC